MCTIRYNESCLHGIISTSKILFLSETVRDVVDIKLSKRFNSPTNILGNLIRTFFYYNLILAIDTPCTAAIHLVAREPEIADAWFAGRNGCFEPPVLGVLPSRVSIPKLEVILIGKIYQIIVHFDVLSLRLDRRLESSSNPWRAWIRTNTPKPETVTSFL